MPTTTGTGPAPVSRALGTADARNSSSADRSRNLLAHLSRAARSSLLALIAVVLVVQLPGCASDHGYPGSSEHPNVAYAALEPGSHCAERELAAPSEPARSSAMVWSTGYAPLLPAPWIAAPVLTYAPDRLPRGHAAHPAGWQLLIMFGIVRI